MELSLEISVLVVEVHNLDKWAIPFLENIVKTVFVLLTYSKVVVLRLDFLSELYGSVLNDLVAIF